MKAVWWIKRDFRIFDNDCIRSALLECGEVLPFFCWESKILEAEDFSLFHLQAQWQALEQLSQNIQKRGGSLCVARGELIREMNVLHQKYSFTHLFTHEETGNLISFQRDRAVARWCRVHGVEWQEFTQSSVLRGGSAETLGRLRREARAKLAASRRQVAGTLGTLVEEARAGVRMVGAGAAATADLRGKFSTINALCTECSDLIEHHDLISQLTSAVHHLGVVIDEAQNVQAIPSRASEAQMILADPEMDMLEGYGRVLELEAASSFARAVLDSQSRKGGVQATSFE